MRVKFVPASRLVLPAKRLPTFPVSSLSIAVKRGVYDLVPDIDSLLIKSINRWGVVYPIVVNSDGVVLDGVRRVNALRVLYGDGARVPAIVLDDEDASLMLDATSMGLIGMGESMNVLAALGAQGPALSSRHSVRGFELFGDDVVRLISMFGFTVEGVPSQASIYIVSESN